MRRESPEPEPDPAGCRLFPQWKKRSNLFGHGATRIAGHCHSRRTDRLTSLSGSSRDQPRCARAEPFVGCCARQECSSDAEGLVEPEQLDADLPGARNLFEKLAGGASRTNLSTLPPSPSGWDHICGHFDLQRCQSLGSTDAKRVPPSRHAPSLECVVPL